MRVNELFLETKKKKKRKKRKKWGLIYWILAVCRFALSSARKKKRGNKIVRFEEKENELKRRKEKAGS